MKILKFIFYIPFFTFSLICIIVLGLGDIIKIWIPEFEKINDFSKTIFLAVCIGGAYVFGSGFWKIKPYKVENLIDIIYRTNIWENLISIIIGLSSIYFMIISLEFTSCCSFSYLVKILVIILFTFLPLSFYIIKFIKNWNSFIMIDDKSLNIQLNREKNIFQFEDIESIQHINEKGFASSHFVFNLYSGHTFKLNYSILKIDPNDLYRTLYHKSKFLVQSENNILLRKFGNEKYIFLDTNNISICVNYSSNQGISDLNLCAFILDINENVISDEHFIFYNNLRSPDKSVKLLSENKLYNSDECMNINMSFLPSWAKIIRIYIANSSEIIHNQQQGLKNSENINIQILDTETKNKIIEYSVSLNLFQKENLEALIFLRNNNLWQICAPKSITGGGIHTLVNIYCKDVEFN